MKLAVLILATAVALIVECHACLNHHLKADAIDKGQEALAGIMTRPEGDRWQGIRQNLSERLTGSRDVKTLNDLAVAMIHTGSTAEAVPLLEEIERVQPGLYQTATNLGTAYELLGRSKEALQWIQRGIEINPHSHEGSEWIHVAVLKAKLALEKDPQWLEKNRVLGMYFGDGMLPAKPEALPVGNNGERMDISQVRRAIETQLRERLQFVNPPDEIVAQLLYDYASLTVLAAKSRDAGFPVYRLAREYATTEASLKALKRMLLNSPLTTREKFVGWSLSMFLMSLVLLGSLKQIRRAGKRQQSEGPDERVVLFPPSVTILIASIAALWITFSKWFIGSMLGVALSLLLLAAGCAGIVLLAKRGEQQRRQTGEGTEFTLRAFTTSSLFFAAAWIAVTYFTVR